VSEYVNASAADDQGYLRNAQFLDIMRMGETCSVWNYTNMFLDVPSNGLAAAGAFYIVHEHHAAILSLFGRKMYSSAFALLRPCFEALVRGIWLVRGATTKQINFYVNGRDTKKVEGFLSDIRQRSKDAEDKALALTWTTSEKSLHRFTHVSYQLLLRRMGVDEADGCTPLLPVSDVINGVKFATSCSLWSSIEIARLGARSDLEQHARQLLAILQPADEHPKE
jgi:hypothetical protein